MPQATTIYYADGITPHGQLGDQNRTVIPFDQIPVTCSTRSSRPRTRTFYTNAGVDYKASFARRGTTSPAATGRVPRRSPSSTPGSVPN